MDTSISMDQILAVASAAFGWLYFICWSISFYPQAIINHQRKSVTGLSVDFVIASFYGFFCYSIFNCGMYFSELVKEQYRIRHGGNENLVKLNDVIFAVHATIVTAVYCLQVVLYRLPNEGPSKVGVALAIGLTVLILTGAIMVMGRMLLLLDYLYALSCIKVILTIIKYIPQAWLNYLRRSTSGWSITNVMLDLLGGLFSIAQLVLDGVLSGHLAGILGFLTKLALGGISIIFDTVFILQHCYWFPESAGPHIASYDRFEPNGDGEETEESKRGEGMSEKGTVRT